MFTPKHFTLVVGTGSSKYELVAFDKALISAGIGDYNLVKVSSIIPVGCKYEPHLSNLEKGSILYAAYCYVNVISDKTMTAAIAASIPSDESTNGVIFEATSDDSYAEEQAIEMCHEAMENRNRQNYTIKSGSITISGKVDCYSCGVAAVVMW